MTKYKVEFYKESRLLEARGTATERATLEAIDAMISAVHRGEHGVGAFQITADKVNDLGLFEESFFDSETFTFPLAARAA